MLLVFLKSTAAILAAAMFVGDRTTASTWLAGASQRLWCVYRCELVQGVHGVQGRVYAARHRPLPRVRAMSPARSASPGPRRERRSHRPGYLLTYSLTTTCLRCGLFGGVTVSALAGDSKGRELDFRPFHSQVQVVQVKVKVKVSGHVIWDHTELPVTWRRQHLPPLARPLLQLLLEYRAMLPTVSR